MTDETNKKIEKLSEKVDEKIEEFGDKIDERIEEPDEKGKIDILLSKLVSRKLLVWAVATGMLIGGQLSAEWWGYLSVAYLGSQGCVDLISTLKRAG